MRTTVRIDDELLERLKEQARKENTSLTRLLDRTLRAGMQASRKPGRPRRRYREQSHAMGAPRIKLNKALAPMPRRKRASWSRVSQMTSIKRSSCRRRR